MSGELDEVEIYTKQKKIMDNYQNHSISFLETEVDDVEWVKEKQE